MSIDTRATLRRTFALAFVVVCGVVAWRLTAPPVLRSETGDRTASRRGRLQADERATIELFRKSSPSVVYITSLRLRRDWLSFNVFEIPQGTGSGFVWDRRGHIVTNYHVVSRGQRAQVTLADQTTWDAEVVGVAPDHDLAVLRIDAPASKLRPIPIGTSADLEVGQNVLAIGNPFGLDQTLTTGIISALGREIQSLTKRPIAGVIQTDAAINPGNSGGPLLDSAGRLIGVNTAIYSPSGAYAGIGFAVPVDTVARFIPQLIRYQKVIKPGLGVYLVPDSIARRYKLRGVLVGTVSRGSAAEQAGMRGTRETRRGVALGDQIIGVDGNRIEDTRDLYRILDKRQVGDRVVVTVLRDDRQLDLEVVLQAID